MRRVLVLLVVLAAGVVVAGLALPAEAVSVNGSSLSSKALSMEMQAIAASPSYQCYVEARQYHDLHAATTSVTGDTSRTWSTSFTSYWADLRVNQLAVGSYVEANDPAAFSPQALATAQVQLAGAIDDAIDTAYSESQQASSEGGATYSCPAAVVSSSQLVPGATILATMPTWFQQTQVRAEAAAIGLTSLLPNAVPVTGPGLEAWFAAHKAEFDTTCLSIIVVSSVDQAKLVESKVAHGLSFADAAKRFSTYTNAKQGGSLGCYGPSDPQAFNQVQDYVGGTATGKIAVTQSGTSIALFSPTKRTANRFGAIRTDVAAEAESIDATNAGVLATAIQSHGKVTVSPDLGTWQPSEVGGTIVPPVGPPADSITVPTTSSPAS